MESFRVQGGRLRCKSPAHEAHMKEGRMSLFVSGTGHGCKHARVVACRSDEVPVPGGMLGVPG